jgi:hypothetical protein
MLLSRESARNPKIYLPLIFSKQVAMVFRAVNFWPLEGVFVAIHKSPRLFGRTSRGWVIHVAAGQKRPLYAVVEIAS